MQLKTKQRNIIRTQNDMLLITDGAYSVDQKPVLVSVLVKACCSSKSRGTSTHNEYADLYDRHHASDTTPV